MSGVDWTRYDKCGCGAAAGRPCLALLVNTAVRRELARPHRRRPRLPTARRAAVSGG